MKKNGFLSVTTIFAFFLVFLSLMLFLILNMSTSRFSLNELKKFIKGDLVSSSITYGTLSDYIISLYTGVQGENNIYYHNGFVLDSDGNQIDAGDFSYRYSGSSVDVNNYVCFGSDDATCPHDNLYRIIGVFGDNNHGITGENLVKLIKADYATTAELGTNGDYKGIYSDNKTYYQGNTSKLSSIGGYYWNKVNYNVSYSVTGYYNDWSYSELNKTNLNSNYTTYLGDWINKIESVTWKVGGNTYDNISNAKASVAYKNEVVNPDTTQVTSTYSDGKIGLMYVSDYGFAASPSAWTTTLYNYYSSSITSNNWMYMGLYEWTIARSSSDSDYTFSVDGLGFVYGNDYYVDSYGYGVRPVFYLKSSTTYQSGSGTSTDPIRIN